MSAVIAPQAQPSGAAATFLRRRPTLFINNEWVDAQSGKTIPVVDPATGEQIAVVADAGQADVDRAVASARAALEQGDWATMLPSVREALMWRLSDLIEQNADELAELESLDNG